MRKRKLDFTPFLSALRVRPAETSTGDAPEQTYAHWAYLQDVSVAQALDDVARAVERFPDDPQSVYERASFWCLACFATYFFEEEMSVPFGGQHDVFFRLLKHDEREKHLNILAPRGSGKSTCVARIYPLWKMFYYDVLLAHDLPVDAFILVISYSYMQAKDHLLAIRDKIEGDARFAHLEGTRIWGNAEIQTAQGVYLVPLSVGKSLRGVLKGRSRPTLVILDDTDSSDTVRNPEMREKARTWHDTSLLPAGQAGYTNFVQIDTTKHPEAMSMILQTRPSVRTTHMRAIPQPADLYHPDHEDRWEQWAKIYSDLSVEDVVREERAQRYYDEHEAEMTAGVQELWPERLSYLQIRKFIIERGYRFTMQEFQNSLSADDEFIFDMDKASRFKVVRDGFQRSDDVLIKWNQMAGATCFLDWSGTRSDTRDNCFACVVCVVWVPQRGRVDAKWGHMAGTHAYVFSSWIERGTGATQYTALLDIFDAVRGVLLSKVTSHVPQFHCVQEGFIDTTGFVKPGAIHMFQSVLEKRAFKDVDLMFLSRAGAEEKHTRIRLLQAPFDNGWLHFNEVLPAEFERQLSLFPTADFDDGPDALEGACHQKFCIDKAIRPYPYRKGSAEDLAVQRAAQNRRRISF